MATMLISCVADEEVLSPSDSSHDNESVSICFSIGNGNSTRATIDGSDNLNENAINRLDLFVSSGANFLHEGIDVTSETSSISNVENSTTDKLWKLSTISKGALTGATVYLIANWDATTAKAITTLDGLKQALKTHDSFAPNQTQTNFIMDGSLVVSDENLTSKVDNATTKWILSKISLKRAVAKIRLTVMLETKESFSSIADRRLEDVTKDIAYQLFHYSPQGTVIAENSELFAKGATTYNSKTNDLLNIPTTVDNYMSSSAMLTVNEKEVNIENINEKRIVSYTNNTNYDLRYYENNGTAPTDGSSTGGFDAAVFYSYPNDWFDEESLNKNNSMLYSKAPIISNRQTYIYIKGTYNDNYEYFYKVPIQNELPTINDVAYSSWSEEEKTALHNLYRLQRNKVYDITAFIDRQGGQDGVFVQYSVNDWDADNSYTTSDFAAKMTAPNGYNEASLNDNTTTAIAVAYSETNKTNYSPLLQLEVTDLPTDGDNDRDWLIQVDNPYFTFLDKEGNAQQVIKGTGKQSVTFYVVPKEEIDESNTSRSLDARIYVTLPSAGSSKMPLNASSLPYDNKNYEVLIRQVSSSSYTTSTTNTTTN